MIPSPISMPVSSSDVPGSGGTLVSIDGRTLPLRSAALHGRARGGYGRIVLEQRFVNPHAEVLRVTYQVPLPADGAVAGFRFRIGDQVVVGEVDRKQRARERFERAIVEGRTAALLEQERSSLFTQEVGNIPPGAEVTVELSIDQKLRWLPDADRSLGGWEWRFPTVVAPRYLGAPGRVSDGAQVAVAVADRPRPITMELRLEIADGLAAEGRPRSPSHGLAIERREGSCEVAFADDGVGLDRDVVVRWPVVAPQVGLSLDVGRTAAGRGADEHAYGLLTVVPPAVPSSTVSRDLIILLDTSGSMHGEPLAQAKHVAAALVRSLGEGDTLELIEFSSAVRHWHRKAKAVTHERKGQALEWIASLRASGGTEMRSGIMAALSGLRSEAQRQVVLVTDGLIGFESEIVEEIHERLPLGSRVHTVGIGSAVNRSLTGPAARAGRGLEVIIGIGEDPERAATRLLARTASPIVVDLELGGDVLVDRAPEHLPDLFAGAPALLSAKLRPEGGTLVLRGRTEHGPWAAQVQVPAQERGQGSSAMATLYAREKVEDLELRRAAGERGVDEAVAGLGLTYQISTRMTSWIAVTQEATVDPLEPSRRETVPQQLPHGMSVEGLGLRGAAAGAPAPAMAAPAGAPMAPPVEQAKAATRGGFFGRLRSRAASPEKAKKKAEAPSPIGMARDDAEDRASREVPAERSAGVAKPGRPAPRPAAPAAAPPPPPSGPFVDELDADEEVSFELGGVASPEREEGGAPAESTGTRLRLGDALGEVDDVLEQAADLPEEPASSRIVIDDLDLLQGASSEAKGRGGGGAAAPTWLGATWTGRVVARFDGTVLVEISAPTELPWSPRGEVEVTLADGRRITVRIDAAKTTRAGQIPAGASIRLALVLADDLAEPVALRLTTGSESVQILLTR